MRNAYYGVIKSYKQASDYLAAGRSKDDRPLPGRATRLIRRNTESIAVRYHNTDILTYYASGSIQLNSAGYRTVTTKAKMNEYLPNSLPRVYQDKGVWYIGGHVYADNLVIYPDGTIAGAESEEYVKAQRKLAKQIGKYADGYIKALLAGKIGAPSAGDCWHCLMREESNGKQTLGESVGDDHLREHMAESYYVPSLLKRAIEVYPVSRAAMAGLYGVWNKDNDQAKWLQIGGTVDQLRSSLRRYLKSQMDLESSR